MRSNFSISVVIPTFNRQNLLERAIASVLDQTIKADEIIIVDNGVSRADIDCTSGYIRVVRAPINAGVSQARNIGLVLARSSYVAFLDDDDCWSERYIERIKGAISASPDCAVFVSSLHDRLTRKPISGKNEFGSQGVIGLIRRNPGVVGSNTVVKKDVMVEMGGYDHFLSASEDIDIAIRARRDGLIISRVVDAIVLYDSTHSQKRLSNIWNLASGKARLVRKHIKNPALRVVLIVEYFIRLVREEVRK